MQAEPPNIGMVFGNRNTTVICSRYKRLRKTLLGTKNVTVLAGALTPIANVSVENSTCNKFKRVRNLPFR